MVDEIDPSDILRQLLAERERAKKSVYTAAIARERAEEEAAHKEKLLQMQIEEAQKLAAENAGLKSKLEQADKSIVVIAERAEKEQERAESAERREKILETILHRVEDELHDAILEEVAPLEDEDDDKAKAWTPPKLATDESGMTDAEADAYLARLPGAEPHDSSADTFDYAEDEARELRETIREVKGSKLVNGLTNARSAVVNSLTKLSCRARLYLVAAASWPFVFMLVVMALASQGVYIDALRPLWTDVISDYGKVIVGVFVPVVLFGLWYVTCVRHIIDSTKNVPATDFVKEIIDTTGVKKTDDGDDEYLAALKEILGEEDDDGTRGPEA